MTEAEATFDPTNELVVSLTMMEVSFRATEFQPLPDSNQERNSRIDEAFGDAASTLTLHDNDMVEVDEIYKQTRNGANTFRAVLDLAMQYPDIWLPLADLSRLATRSTPYIAISDLQRKFRRPIITKQKAGGRSYVRLASDIKIFDERQVAEPDITSSQSAPDEIPAPFGLPNLATFGRLVIDDAKVMRATTPRRFVRILNIPEVNAQTQELVAFQNQRHSDRPPVVLPTFSFLDDHHAEHAQQPFEYGPFARSMFHALLEKYLTEEALAVPFKNVSKEDSEFRGLEVKIQEFMRSLLMRQMISAATYTENGLVLIKKARLKPMLFDDRRIPYPSLRPESPEAPRAKTPLGA